MIPLNTPEFISYKMHIIWGHGFIIWYNKSWFQISRLFFDVLLRNPDSKSCVYGLI